MGRARDGSVSGKGVALRQFGADKCQKAARIDLLTA